MIKIIEDIVRAENEAEAMIQTTRERATQKRRQIEESLAAELVEAREKAREEASKRIEEAREHYRRALEAARSAASGSSEQFASFLEEHRDAIERLVDDIVDYLLTPEFRRG